MGGGVEKGCSSAKKADGRDFLVSTTGAVHTSNTGLPSTCQTFRVGALKNVLMGRGFVQDSSSREFRMQDDTSGAREDEVVVVRGSGCWTTLKSYIESVKARTLSYVLPIAVCINHTARPCAR